ncbi:MAG: glutathione S-transferase [Solirubrobacterales bacterium]|nr:glutathione S-transferase [Solirubrobacterales bacterium]
MAAKLYVVHGSHPCAAVRRALDLKGVKYKLVEFPPPFHVPYQRLRFGKRTVPGIRFENGEKLLGSTAILKRLDQLAPEPRMYPDARVEEAEAWAEAVLQPMARRLLWRAFQLNHGAMHGYQKGGRLPALPRPVVWVMAPVITRLEGRMNAVADGPVREDLRALPAHLGHVDALIADGVIGGETPNAADLQIGSSLRLMMTLGDVRPMFAERPAAQLALRLFPDQAGDVPAGTFPAGWVPTGAPDARSL